jgi:hypothetical protein
VVGYQDDPGMDISPSKDGNLMSPGDRICVQTDRGNYEVLTLRTVSSVNAVNLDIDYVAWVR